MGNGILAYFSTVINKRSNLRDLQDFSVFSVNNVRSAGLISISLMCDNCVKLLLCTRVSKALPYIPLAFSRCGA